MTPEHDPQPAATGTTRDLTPRPRTAARLAKIMAWMATDLRRGASVQDIASRLDGVGRFFTCMRKIATEQVRGAA